MEFDPDQPTLAAQRNWIPLVIAVVLVAAVLGAGMMLGNHPRPPVPVISPTAATDPYAPNLPISNLLMSESSNLAGGKVTYIDGHIANHGGKTVSAIEVQVVFRNFGHEVAQNDILPLTLIRMREPYIDTEMVAADPIKPGAEKDFRLIFDRVSPDWAGETPDIRVLRVDSK